MACNLDLSQLDEVVRVLKKHCYSGTNWYSFGLSLGLLVTTLDIIEKNYKDDTSRCLLECLKKWLSKVDKVSNKGGTTWIALTNSLRSIDENNVAEKIDQEKQPANYILYCHYTALTSDLVNPVSVSRSLYDEKIISPETLTSIRSVPQSPTSRRQLLFTAVQDAVYINCRHLETFANILCNFTDSVPLGNSILNDYEIVFTDSNEAEKLTEAEMSDTSSNESDMSSVQTENQIFIPRSMCPEFKSMRDTFGSMFSKFRRAITKQPPLLKDLKTFLEDCRPNLAPQLAHVRRISSLLSLIRENCTLIDIGIIESVIQQYEIVGVDGDIREYKKEVGVFCKSVTARLCLKEKLEVIKLPSPLQCETATFVLDWKPDDYTLNDIKDLLSKSLDELHMSVKIRVIEETKSITVTCSFPVNLTGSLIAIALKNLDLLKKEGLLQLTIGYCTLWEKDNYGAENKVTELSEKLTKFNEKQLQDQEFEDLELTLKSKKILQSQLDQAHNLPVSQEPQTETERYSHKDVSQDIELQHIASNKEKQLENTSLEISLREATEIMEVKAMRNSSPLEGSGQMALVFNKPIPQGDKFVYFVSSSNPSYYQVQPAIYENPHTLSCTIPKYPIPEKVELKVYCEQQPFAATVFTYYNQPSDMLLQILNSTLQSHFLLDSTRITSTSTFGQAMGGATYTGYIPSSMYQLLLGACRMGCEPLVYCLLCSPVMEEIPMEILKEAKECAKRYGHSDLADHLSMIYILHDMTTPSNVISQYTEIGGMAQSKHVPAYYDAIDQLDQGGDTPQERAETILRALRSTMNELGPKGEENVKRDDLVKNLNEEQNDIVEPTVEHLLPPLIITDPGENVVEDEDVNLTGQTSISHRRLSSDDDDYEINLKPVVAPHSRASWSESFDVVPDLPHYIMHPFNQLSDADSAIGSMSYEEDVILSDIRRQRSSLTSDLANDIFSVTLPQQAGAEASNSLQWEAGIIVTEDYPPGQGKKIFHKGDQIVKVGDILIKNMTAETFGDLFQQLASTGTTVLISSVQSELPRPSKQATGEQSIMTNKIKQLLDTKPSSERRVTIPFMRAFMSSDFGIKFMGGKNVGVFISDVPLDITQLSIGDQITAINGHTTYNLSLYDVVQLLHSSTGPVELTVIENKTMFSIVQEQVELDSFYLRSLVDYFTLKKGSLLRVVNTCAFSTNHFWLAWLIDERTGNEIQLKKIFNPHVAFKKFGRPVYQKVDCYKVHHQRPICIVGHGNDELAHNICIDNSFKLCHNIEDVLDICSQGVHHGVLSVSDLKQVKLLSSLWPIVLQTPIDKLEQAKFSALNVNVYHVGNKTSEPAKEAIEHIHQIQSLPVWRELGLAQ